MQEIPINSRWDKILAEIKKQISAQSYKTWFEPIVAVDFTEDSITLQVPNKFFFEWIEEHYVGLMKSIITSVFDKEIKLFYKFEEKPTENSDILQGDSLAEHIKNPFLVPGIKRLKVDSQLKPDYQFESFIEGDFNRLARNAGLVVAKKPGETAFNPLYISSDSGLGKTHLAQAIGNEISNRFEQKTVLYVPADRFSSQMAQAIQNEALNDFLNFYRFIDVVIIDDIQFLGNNAKVQEAFLQLFDSWQQDNKQIIITADQAPIDLQGFDKKLVSRFKSGLSADIDYPDFETRCAILESKLNSEGIDIPQDVLEFICLEVSETNIRELEGAVISLVAQSTLIRRDIDLDLAKEIIYSQIGINGKKRFFINLPEEFRVAVKQYLTYFNEFTKYAKGESFDIEVASSDEGISINFPKTAPNSKFQEYLKEYLSFIKMKIDEIDPDIITDIPGDKYEKLTLELKSQVQHLQHSLELKNLENKHLDITNGLYSKLFETQTKNPAPIIINNTNNNSLKNKPSTKNINVYKTESNSQEIFEELKKIKEVLLQDKSTTPELISNLLPIINQMEKEASDGKVKKSLVDKFLEKTSKVSSIGSFVINLIKILNGV